MSNPIIMNMSGVYDAMKSDRGFLINDKEEILDCKLIPGTDCYCDDSACTLLKQCMDKDSYRGIHYIDSGNYHYISKLWTEQIDTDFSLVVFDHHPDMQPPMLGDILSCGSWIKDTLDSNSRLQQVLVIGVNGELLDCVEEKYLEKVTFITKEMLSASKKSDNIHCIANECNANECDSLLEKFINSNSRIYLSIDKDVLSAEEVQTNWDQGNMTLENMINLIKKVTSKSELMGVDICGEMSYDKIVTEELSKSMCVNQRLFEVLDNILINK